MNLEAVWRRNRDVWHQVLANFRGASPVESLVFHDSTVTEAKASTVAATVSVELIEKDCVYAAIDQIRLGFNPLLLNMASDFTPGGGVGKGARAQEEDLFRRSNYFLHLHPKYYPMKSTTCIISEQVLFYRLAASENYEHMQTPTKIDCIAAAALRKPVVTDAGTRFAYKSDRDLMHAKIRGLFRAAQQHGNDCLVLSAWGCGAFKCPIREVAQLFREVVEEYHTNGNNSLKKVVFAIHDTATFREFKDAFEA